MNKSIAVAAALGACLAAGGCVSPNGSPGRGNAGGPTIQLAETTVGVGSGGRASSALAAAQNWKDKYTARTEECLKLQRESTALDAANRDLKAELVATASEMAQAKKELSEANTTLKELDAELAKWQQDVLGFRDEMRLAQRAELELLVKMVVLLGGEAPIADDKAEGGTAVSPKAEDDTLAAMAGE